MSRLRATLSSSPLDREVAQRVETARREIQAALRVCSVRQDDLVSRRRQQVVRRDLEKILGAMASVRRVTAPYDQGDPDLTDTPQGPPPPKRTVPPPVVRAPKE